MRIGLCTTTIHVPHALKLMRKCSADVRFFVAVDKKTPPEIATIVDGNTKLLTETIQNDWKCSEAIGWNTLARRNIAFLEALKWGADVIYSWDNDNVPVDVHHWQHIWELLAHNVMSTTHLKFNGIKVTGDKGWFDPGQLLIPATRHRGFPHNKPVSKQAHPVTDAKVGVAAGLVIGDPDCDASTRIERRPEIGQVHILGSTGVVVDSHTWTVFNSQNTAVIRELIPAWFMMPGVGRHDDIYASLIVQRVARERGLHVHFGPPFTYQQRNKHDLVSDLRAEIDGMENVYKLAKLLDAIILPGKSVIEDVRIIYTQLRNCAFIPLGAATAGLTWIEDCEGVI
jgi:hypothetical protein